MDALQLAEILNGTTARSLITVQTGKPNIIVTAGYDDNAPALLDDDTALVFVAQTNEYSTLSDESNLLIDTYGFMVYWLDSSEPVATQSGVMHYPANDIVTTLTASLLSVIIAAFASDIITKIERVTMAASMRPQYQAGAIITIGRVNTNDDAL